MITKIHLPTLGIIFALLFSSLNCWSGKIYRPWRSTTAIVLAGESFEVWFDASSSQSIESIELSTAYFSVACSFSAVDGNWEVDPLSGNRFDQKVTVTVPLGAPSDRYDLVLHTNLGDEISHGGVKVLKEFKQEYYIMHISDGHLYQAGYDPLTLLARKTAMIQMANIMDCQLIVETGDNMYNVRNHPEREVIYFQGDENQGIFGMADATAATFLVPGDHDAYKSNDWPQASVQVNSDFFNDYWGLQSSNFKYGNGRFMMLNNGWGVSESNAGDHQYQIDEAVTWLGEEGAGGNFFLTAGHTYNKMHEFIDDHQALSLVLAGDKHHIHNGNPYSFDDGSPEVAYIAGSIRDHFTFNLFKVNNETGVVTAVSGENAVVEVLKSGDKLNPETWEENISVEFEHPNSGLYYENAATIVNHYNFSIENATVRFFMPKEFDYRASNASVIQEFDGDNFRIMDLSFDLPANSNITVSVGDADLCPDDPDKTDPGLCGCGIPEGTCETDQLIVNSGTGDGAYYPYESVNITADQPAEDQLFNGWQIVSGSPAITDPSAAKTDLILKGEPAEVTATYKQKLMLNDAAFTSHYIPPAMQGENLEVRITMKNTGTTTWTKQRGYFLGSQNPENNTIWGAARIDLDDTDSILEGESKTFVFTVSAPEEDDLFNFQWQMNQVDSTWFGAPSANQLIRTSGSDQFLDECESTSGWKTSPALSLDQVNEKQGLGCLSFSGAGADEFKRSFATPFNPGGSEEGTILQFWYFVSDASKLSGSNQVELGSGGTNDADEFNWSMTGLVDGWNYIRLPIRAAGKVGDPDITALNWFRLYTFKSAQITTKIDAIQLISDGQYIEVTLTVNNGIGAGIYRPGDRFHIIANDASQGEVFDQWEINSGSCGIQDFFSPVTYITIGDSDSEVTARFKTDPTLSIETKGLEPVFKVYPNPSNGAFTLRFNLTNRVEVKAALLDLSGRQIGEILSPALFEAGSHTQEVHLQGIKSGGYMLQMMFEQKVITRFLVIR